MIGWRANYGYSDLPFTSLTSLSDIVFTDENCPFIIPTYVNIIPDITYQTFAFNPVTSSGWNFFSYLFTAQNTLESILGEFYSVWYAMPFWGNIKPYNIEKLVPSLRKACPNLWSYFEGDVNSRPFRTSCCYIPGLKRVFSCDNTSTGAVSILIYSVDSDGSLIQISNPRLTSPPKTTFLMCQYAATIALVGYNGTKESLLDPNNCYGIYVEYNSTSTKVSPAIAITRARSATQDDKDKVGSFLAALFGDFTTPDIDFPENPYDPGGTSGPGGGGGTFDNGSDLIELPPIPTLSSANTGFTRIYNPTLSQVQQLANYLWTDETVIETIWNHIKQFFENPMEAIIGFNLVPVPVPDGGTQNFALMYIDTGVSMTVAASQFVDVDCGTLTIDNYYGSALDYSPYTKVSCFLPYVGMVSLSADEVMGRTLQIIYRVDICSGSCVANILVDGNVLYQYSGHCAITIPLASADFSSYVSAAISVGKLAGAALLAGSGIVAPPAPITATQQTNQTVTTTTTDTARNPTTGRQITTGSQTVVQSTESSQESTSSKASYNGLTPQSVSNTVGEVVSSKPHIEHSGSFSGNSGYLGVRRPYVIIERPRMCMPGDYQKFNGFPCMMKLNLGNCHGFTRVQQIHLTGLWATNPEQAEILELLKMGVIL